MAYCGKCGNQIEEGVKFCLACGAALQVAQPETVQPGHVAVIAQTFKDGRVPDNCVSVGKAMVKDRFGTANAYFAIDKLVSGAVKQLQRTNGYLF